MRIIFFSSDNNVSSGAFLCLVSMVKMLRDNYKIEPLIILPTKGNGEKILIENQIPYRFIKSYTWTIPFNQSLKNVFRVIRSIFVNYIAINKIRKIIEEYKPALVHINTSWTYAGAIAAYQKKIPVVWHIREYLEEDQNRRYWNKQYSYQQYNKAKKVITISNDLYNKYSKVLDNNKMTVIYDGVDIAKYHNPEKDIFTDSEINTFIITGGLYKGKCHIDLINALKIVKDRGYGNFMLHIVGKGKEELNLKSQVNALDLQKNIIFEGFQSNTVAYYNKADVMFMTSRCEAFGRVTVEAMLSGLLVIGSNSGATPEIIGDRYGYLYERGNSEDLAEKIIYVIEHKEEARSKMKAGRQMALEKFSSKKNTADIYKLFSEISKS